MNKQEFGHDLSEIRNLHEKSLEHKAHAKRLREMALVQDDSADACSRKVFAIIDKDFLEVRDKFDV